MFILGKGFPILVPKNLADSSLFLDRSKFPSDLVQKSVRWERISLSFIDLFWTAHNIARWNWKDHDKRKRRRKIKIHDNDVFAAAANDVVADYVDDGDNSWRVYLVRQNRRQLTVGRSYLSTTTNPSQPSRIINNVIIIVIITAIVTTFAIIVIIISPSPLQSLQRSG